MNEIKDCIDALLAAVQNSEEYQKFEKYRDLLKENPELMDRVNAFRGNNFRLQNEANRDELFRGTGAAQQRIQGAAQRSPCKRIS